MSFSTKSCTRTQMTMDAIDEEALQRAQNYLAGHKIDELMRDLVAAISFYKPENVRQFLLQELQRRERQGPAAGLFSEKEIEAVFELADVDMDGFLSKEDCRTALQYICLSLKSYEEAQHLVLAEKISKREYLNIARRLLKLHTKAPGDL